MFTDTSASPASSATVGVDDQRSARRSSVRNDDRWARYRPGAGDALPGAMEPASLRPAQEALLGDLGVGWSPGLMPSRSQSAPAQAALRCARARIATARTLFGRRR